MTHRIRSLKSNLFILTLLCLAPISAIAQIPLTVTLTGKVVDATPQSAYFNASFGTAGENAGLRDAAVMIKTGGNLIAHFRTVTDSEGNFGQANGSWRNAAIPVADGGQAYLIVLKAGYTPDTTLLTDFTGNIGNIELRRDPLERRIDSVMNMMTTIAEKIAQMTQPGLEGTGGGFVSAPHTGGNLFGSVLHGGDGYSSTFLTGMVSELNSWPAGRARIPVYYGKDAVHGNAGVTGYTVFPHNIGLGATRDSALVRRIGEATAKQLWAARIDLNFSPAISVAQDPRWGRTYESYGETAELTVQMGAAMVRGLQGGRFDAPWRITATAKHFLADGGTADGKDRGNTLATDSVLRAVHLPGYEAVVDQGVLSIMASFNTIQNPGSSNRVHQHIDSLRMTGWLKNELAFDGYIISDWEGIANSNSPGFHGSYGTTCPGSDGITAPTLTADAVRRAINAGIDLAMEPGATGSFMAQTPNHQTFRNHLQTLVSNGSVSEERINDAVRRILRAKFRAGRMDNFSGPAEFAGNAANRVHSALAREAVAKGQVLLKNEGGVLPLAKNANIHVFGSHHNNVGRQSGGWTINWQGFTGSTDLTEVGTTILRGMQQVTGQTAFSTASNADIIVYVTGEEPYAEWCGDLTSLNFSPSTTDMTNLQTYRNQGKKIVTIFVAGRPRIATELMERSDVFLAAWLPGTEGAGVADILFGDQPVTGRLPLTWPGSSGTQFPYGFGLLTPTAPAAPALVSKSETNVTLRANDIYEFSRDGTTWQTSSVFNGLTALTEYTFFQRLRASNSVSGTASPSSPPLTVTTDAATSVQESDRKIPVSNSNPNGDNKNEPSAIVINEFSAGPNPVSRLAGAINFFWQGKGIENTTLTVYDASGNFIRRIKIGDNDRGRDAVQSKRPVGSWNLTNSKGKQVSEGSYIVKGNIKTRDGKNEKVSIILGIK